jgi:hypothetical protein
MVGRGMLARKGVPGGKEAAQIHVIPHRAAREVLAKYGKEGAFYFPPFPHDSCSLWQIFRENEANRTKMLNENSGDLRRDPQRS